MDPMGAYPWYFGRYAPEISGVMQPARPWHEAQHRPVQISGDNIPADSPQAKIFTRVFGNAIVITALKLAAGQYVIPFLAQVLSRVKFSLKAFQKVGLDNPLAIPAYKTQVGASTDSHTSQCGILNTKCTVQVGSALILTLSSELFLRKS